MASGPGPAKRETLRRLLRGADDLTNAIIFSNRKRDVALLTKSLEKHGFSVGCLHGDMDQRSRMASLDAFRGNKVSLLVCSDVAARGLDIPMVSHVFNFDVPTHAEDYVHRIGRTGRAGRSGTAISIVTKADQRYVDDIEKLIQTKIGWNGITLDEVPEGEADVDERSASRDRRPLRRGEGRGGRGSETRAAPRERSETREKSEPRERAEPRERTEPVRARAPESAVAAGRPAKPAPRPRPDQARGAGASSSARGGGRRRGWPRRSCAVLPAAPGQDQGEQRRLNHLGGGSDMLLPLLFDPTRDPEPRIAEGSEPREGEPGDI